MAPLAQAARTAKWIAVVPIALPGIAHTPQGRGPDFRFSALEGSGIRKASAEPYHPRQKPIISKYEQASRGDDRRSAMTPCVP
jgi:hypothetical protein